MLDRKILDVPHLSQILDVSNKHWQRRSCAIVALAMILQHHIGSADESLQPDNLIEKGLTINAYNQEYGWKHSHLALMARSYGLHGYNQEFESNSEIFQGDFINDGLKKISNSIYNGNPVIVSMESFFSSNRVTHLIVLSGVENEEGKLKGFYYRDPLLDQRAGEEHEFVTLKRFLEFWRKMVIFVSKEA